jgi:DNA polymerase III epsilon subunit family exonuclease
MFRFTDAGEFLKELNGGTEFVAFDLETTGLLPAKDRITEFGAVRFTLSAIKDKFETLIDPGLPITPGATRVSGITDDMVKGKPPVADVLGRFLDFAGGAALIAHNARFDGAFLWEALRRSGRKIIDNLIFDTRLLAKHLWPALPGYSLGKIMEALCLPGAGLHRALGDALACREVFLACLAKIADKKSRSGRLRKRIAFVLTEDDVDETI